MKITEINKICLLYTSDAADDLLCVDLGGRRIIKKKKKQHIKKDHQTDDGRLEINNIDNGVTVSTI